MMMMGIQITVVDWSELDGIPRVKVHWNPKRVGFPSHMLWRVDDPAGHDQK